MVCYAYNSAPFRTKAKSICANLNGGGVFWVYRLVGVPVCSRVWCLSCARCCPTCGIRYTGTCATRIIKEKVRRVQEDTQGDFRVRMSNLIYLAKLLSLDNKLKRCAALCESVLRDLADARATKSEEDEYWDLEMVARAQLTSMIVHSTRDSQKSLESCEKAEVALRQMPGHSRSREVSDFPDEVIPTSTSIVFVSYLSS